VILEMIVVSVGRQGVTRKLIDGVVEVDVCDGDDGCG
jgi:hypothetical protein